MGHENSKGPATTFLNELRQLQGEPRVWVLIAHSKTNEEAAIKAYLDSMGHGHTEFQGSDVILMLCDLQ